MTRSCCYMHMAYDATLPTIEEREQLASETASLDTKKLLRDHRIHCGGMTISDWMSCFLR